MCGGGEGAGRRKGGRGALFHSLIRSVVTLVVIKRFVVGADRGESCLDGSITEENPVPGRSYDPELIGNGDDQCCNDEFSASIPYVV